MYDANARFEFRSFARNHIAVKERLMQLTQTGDVRESSDLYVVAAGDSRHNIKIRDHRLDIKRLIDTRDELEQWRPRLKQDFPLDQDFLHREVFRPLPVATPHLPRAHYTEARFLEEVIRPHPALAVATLSKRRLSFDLDPVSAEFAEVWVNGAGVQTVALESTDPEAVQDLRRRLGLERTENVNYLLAIKRIIGMAPVPSRSGGATPTDAIPPAGESHS